MAPKVALRRRGKEWRERIAAAVLLVPTLPVIAACAVAIKLEGFFRQDARGPVFFTEARVSRGKVIGLLKFRTLTASALAGLDTTQPTHIKELEQSDQVTKVGGVLKQWYLDELPQIFNIVKGDMFLIGTRPYPIELYEEEMSRGITRKRDMPAGLIGPVQASKGHPTEADSVALDAEYWHAFQTMSQWKLLALDLKIVIRSIRTQLQHKGL
ncbi:MAG: sugar transferase [Actinomycetota bacterium]